MMTTVIGDDNGIFAFEKPAENTPTRFWNTILYINSFKRMKDIV